MSDFRITYPITEDTENYVSQQMQVAHVRVRGEDDPRKQEQIVAQLKQQITQFIRFGDNQHRLAGRQHSHFRVEQGGVSMQYVNNTGQPLVYVDVPVGLEAEEEEEDDDEEEEPEVAPFQAFAVMVYEGLPTTLSIRGFGSVTIFDPGPGGPLMSSGDGEEDGEEVGPTNARALIYLGDVPGEVKARFSGGDFDQVTTRSGNMLLSGDTGITARLPGVDEPVPVPLFTSSVSFSIDDVPGGGGVWKGLEEYLTKPVVWMNFLTAEPDTWPLPGPIIFRDTVDPVTGEPPTDPDGNSMAPGDAVGKALTHTDEFIALVQADNDISVTLSVQEDVFDFEKGFSGRARWHFSARVDVSVYLSHPLIGAVKVATGTASASGLNEYTLSGAVRRKAGGRRLTWDETDGWIDLFGLDEPEVHPQRTGETSKAEGSSASASARPRHVHFTTGKSFYSSTEVKAGNVAITLEPPLNPDDLTVEPDPIEITDVNDLGFMRDFGPFDVSGSVRFDFAATPAPVTTGWAFSTSFGGGVSFTG